MYTRRGIAIQPGRYDFNEAFILVNSSRARRVSANVRIGSGTFYDGHKNAYQVALTLRANEHFNVTGSVSRNDIDLPAGTFSTNLVSSRINYNFNTKVFLNALLQYNTDAQQWTSNVRFNIIHRPLSDFFLVYNDLRDSRSGDLVNRALAVGEVRGHPPARELPGSVR